MLPIHLNELILSTRIVSHNTNNVMDNRASLSCSVLIIAVKDPVLTANRIINLSFVVEPNLNNRAFYGFDGNATKSKVSSD